MLLLGDQCAKMSGILSSEFGPLTSLIFCSVKTFLCGQSVAGAERVWIGNKPRAGSPIWAQVGRGDGSPVFIILKTMTVRVTEIHALWSLYYNDQALNPGANMSFDQDRMTLSF